MVQHGLIGLGHRASQSVHFMRTHRVSGPPATTLQFTGLVKIANADPRGDFLLFEAKRASRVNRGGLLCQCLGLDGMLSPAKTYASEPTARQAPMIHGIQLGSGRSSVRFDFFGEADVPSLSAALTGGRNDSLAA